MPRIETRGANAGLAAGVVLNIGLWLFVPALFWFWWNVTGALATWIVATLVSRVAARPEPGRAAVRPVFDLHWPSVAVLVGFFAVIVAFSLVLPSLLARG